MSLAQSHTRQFAKQSLRFSVYCMVTEDLGGFSYFKFGISESPTSRMAAVQTGCPMKIVEILFLPGFSRREAQSAEADIHLALAEHRSSGEWFKFDLTNQEHKAAFNAALKLGMKRLLLHAPHRAMRWIRRSKAEIDSLCEDRQTTVADAEIRMKVRQVHRLVNGRAY